MHQQGHELLAQLHAPCPMPGFAPSCGLANPRSRLDLFERTAPHRTALHCTALHCTAGKCCTRTTPRWSTWATWRDGTASPRQRQRQQRQAGRSRGQQLAGSGAAAPQPRVSTELPSARRHPCCWSRAWARPMQARRRRRRLLPGAGRRTGARSRSRSCSRAARARTWSACLRGTRAGSRRCWRPWQRARCGGLGQGLCGGRCGA